MDMFGSKMSKTQVKPPMSSTASTFENLRISFFDEKAAMASTVKNFAYSLGCMVKKPRLSHLFAP